MNARIRVDRLTQDHVGKSIKYKGQWQKILRVDHPTGTGSVHVFTDYNSPDYPNSYNPYRWDYGLNFEVEIADEPLREERERLVARIAEIDRLLG